MADTTMYQIGQWKGLTQYICLYCPFDSLEMDDAIRHYLLKHAPRAGEMPSPSVLVADRNGNPVTQQATQPAVIVTVEDPESGEEITVPVEDEEAARAILAAMAEPEKPPEGNDVARRATGKRRKPSR